MIIHRKEALLANHAFSRLRLTHAALVDSYPCDLRGSRLPVNRLLVPCADCGEAQVADPATGARIRLRTGALCFIPCNRPVDLCIASDLRFASLHFSLEVFFGVDALADHPRCEDLPAPGLAVELTALLRCDGSLRTLCRINELIFGLCARWLPEEAGDGLPERMARSRQHAAVLEYLRNACDASTTVARLAEIAGMRSDVFSRRFTRDLGVTPKEFISSTVARRASELLMAGDATVTGVAEALGFSSEFYFSHFFKRRTGMSPRDYRLSHRGGAG